MRADRMSGIEREVTGKLVPRHPAQADDDSRPHNLHLGKQMIAAIRDFSRIGIAISSQFIARVASNQISNEDALETGARDHLAQKLSRSIAGEWRPGKVTSKAAGSDSNESHRRGNISSTGHSLRAASHQSIASRA